jgi:sigma54-dependent transcription regulator
VLQEGQIERLGSARTVDVDVRVVAATNRDLAEEVRQNRFRDDLYYRLNVFPITLPSLRERREDIPMLAQHLANRFARVMHKPIKPLSDTVARALQQYDWPGNVRELENVGTPGHHPLGGRRDFAQRHRVVGGADHGIRWDDARRNRTQSHSAHAQHDPLAD